MLEKSKLLPVYSKEVLSAVEKFNSRTDQKTDEKNIKQYIEEQKTRMMRHQYFRLNNEDNGKQQIQNSLENVRKLLQNTEAGQNVYILENELLSSNVLEKLFVFENLFPYTWTTYLFRHSILYMTVFVVVCFLGLFFLFWLLLAVLALNACNGSGQPPHSLFLRANPQSSTLMTCGDIASGCTFAMQGLFSKMDMIQYFSLRVGFYFFSFVPVIFLFVMSSNRMRRIERTLIPTVFTKRGFDDNSPDSNWKNTDRILRFFSAFLFFISHIAGSIVTLGADMGMSRYLTNTLPGEPGCSYSKDSTVTKPSGFTTANCACNELLVQDQTNLPSLTLFQITNLPSLVEATLAFNILYTLWGLLYFLEMMLAIWNLRKSEVDVIQIGYTHGLGAEALGFRDIKFPTVQKPEGPGPRNASLSGGGGGGGIPAAASPAHAVLTTAAPAPAPAAAPAPAPAAPPSPSATVIAPPPPPAAAVLEEPAAAAALAPTFIAPVADALLAPAAATWTGIPAGRTKSKKMKKVGGDEGRGRRRSRSGGRGYESSET